MTSDQGNELLTKLDSMLELMQADSLRSLMVNALLGACFAALLGILAFTAMKAVRRG